jgi:hypothetical protein
VQPDKIRIEVKEGDAETRNKTFREFEMLRFLDSEMEDVVCPEATITRYMNLKGVSCPAGWLFVE